jgi:FixJ family two-component response regulator
MGEKECKVFVVDDDQSLLESVTLLLESAGYQSRGFGSAEELLASGLVQTARCLILDIKLPGMSGFELREYLTATNILTPVIFITSHARLRLEERALRLGAVAYLRKPFDEEALLDAIQRCPEKGGDR